MAGMITHSCNHTDGVVRCEFSAIYIHILSFYVLICESIYLSDPTYMVRAVPSNASDNVYCSLLAHSALHGAMAGYTGFTVGPVNGRHAYIPFYVSTPHSDDSRSFYLFILVNS